MGDLIIPELAKAFLAEDYARIDARLPGWLEELTKVGALRVLGLPVCMRTPSA